MFSPASLPSPLSLAISESSLNIQGSRPSKKAHRISDHLKSRVLNSTQSIMTPSSCTTPRQEDFPEVKMSPRKSPRSTSQQPLSQNCMRAHKRNRLSSPTKVPQSKYHDSLDDLVKKTTVIFKRLMDQRFENTSSSYYYNYEKNGPVYYVNTGNLEGFYASEAGKIAQEKNFAIDPKHLHTPWVSFHNEKKHAISFTSELALLVAQIVQSRFTLTPAEKECEPNKLSAKLLKNQELYKTWEDKIDKQLTKEFKRKVSKVNLKGSQISERDSFSELKLKDLETLRTQEIKIMAYLAAAEAITNSAITANEENDLIMVAKQIVHPNPKPKNVQFLP